MPTYQYECRTQNMGCGHIFDINCSISELNSLEPRCPECRKKKSVFRDYNVRIFTFGPDKTLGSLADKNSSRMSSDQKNFLTKKHNEYKSQEFQGKLPDKASTYQRDANGKRIPRK